MNPQEYEEYVSKVVSQLDCWKGAQIYRNRLYPGVRQPGNYEIDIAFEIMLSEAIFFRLIIECKHWSKPVTRPVVQSLAQTRDAIAAHKAALVSPIGFTEEAISVAEAHGIALWVIAENVTWNRIMACLLYDGGLTASDFFRARLTLLKAYGFKDTEGSISDESTVLIDAKAAHSTDRKSGGVFIRPVTRGSAVPWWSYHPFFDKSSSICTLIESALQSNSHEELLTIERIREEFEDWKNSTCVALAERVGRNGVKHAVDAVIRGDIESFLASPGQRKYRVRRSRSWARG